MGTRDERKRMWKRAIREAIGVLSGDKAFENLDCTVLNIKAFPEEVQRCLIEAVGDVQEEFLLRIGAAAVAFLEEKLDGMEVD